MKRQVRRGLFETNSSSVHTLVMCSSEDYEKWKNGELLFDRWDDKFVESNEENIADDEDLLTYDQYYEDIEYETFIQCFKTEHGDEVVAFGYYGQDY